MNNKIILDDIYLVTLEKIKEDLKTDTYFNKLTKSQKRKLIEKIKKSQCHCAGYLGDNKWHGEVKICPQCKKIRITTCSACGCGNCETCGYRWTCLPVNFPSFNSFIPEFNLKTIINTQPFTIEDNENYII